MEELSSAIAGSTGGAMNILKVCGMRHPDNIREVEALEWNAGVRLMGFIFYPPSPRHVDSVPAYLPVNCKRTGVFVDADEEYIRQHVMDYGLDIVQLHGKETPAFCKALAEGCVTGRSICIIKTIHVSTAIDLEQTVPYEGTVDCFLFETKCKGHGGSGQQFDWSVLQHYKGSTPFMITGGIGPEDAARVKAFRHPRFIGIDINSRFETSPAIKDTGRLARFMQELHEG